MLQIAYAGRRVITDSISDYEDSPVYYEPGFNQMGPLTIASEKADYVYLLLRKRSDDSGNNFESISSSNFEITAKDYSNGEEISAYMLSSNTVNPEWETDPSTFTPIVCYIQTELNPSNPIRRIKVIECCITDTTDNNFIRFKINVDDDTGYLHYIHVVLNSMEQRNQYTAVGDNIYIKVNKNSDSYLLVSPYAYLRETTKELSDFSYPLNTVFYTRQRSFNEEEFDFSIFSYFPSYLREYISFMNIPNFHKAGVILIDRYLYQYLESISSSTLTCYMNVRITGKLSGSTKNFVIHFIR